MKPPFYDTIGFGTTVNALQSQSSSVGALLFYLNTDCSSMTPQKERKDTMKKLFFHPLWSILVIPVLGLIYVTINREPPLPRTLYTDLDDTIPFLKYFIIPYMVWMPFLYLTLIYFYFKDRRLYFHTLLAYIGSVLICYGIYLTFQTTVPRLEMQDNDLLSRMVMFVYQNDAPYNCFPSIHCLSSYLLFIAARKSPAIRIRVVVVIGFFAGAIIVSTVFVKQHVVMDVLAGVMLGHIVFSFVSTLLGLKKLGSVWMGKEEIYETRY
ncbi:phosphatase PAP2 family protein [Cohnella sp.]|uniref:phosphatase PAP2 family protein n=1 Tax=Cohnella sp. TaxID=1883426 RepID=UPI00356AEDBF